MKYALAFLLSLAMLVPGLSSARGSDNPRTPNPGLIASPGACGSECHKKEMAIWQRTKHAVSFDQLPSSDKARKMMAKLGVTNMKRDATCISCHFTPQTLRGQTRLIAGVGCESCHGEGREWFEIHGDYGGKHITRQQEDPAHRQARISRSEAAGMVRPAKLHTLLRRCYDCHMGMDEKVVNQGGHTPLSDLDPLSWTQNKVGDYPTLRHNVFFTEHNAVASPERRRLMYVLGVAMDLEYSLRALARGTVNGPFTTMAAQRAKGAARKLAAISKQTPLPEIQGMMGAARKVRLKLGAASLLNGIANELKHYAGQLAAQRNGSELAALDGLIPWLPPKE
ncbi:MAG: cytochrome c family protein [Magnetococcales bacterium]|nr:cytochrome c family protein [Magnetococcales bacterium]